jgi:sterol desaturase/sphingolipid hydroxylase (fatty acid hydroxylase superfamily)
LIREVFRLTNGLVLLAAILIPIEKLFALRAQKTLREGFAGDIGYYYLTSLLPNRVLAIPLGLLAVALARFTPPWSLALPVWLRVALSLVVAEIGFYWGHRWSHQFAWLWRFHSIHHSAREMDWLVNTHAHPVDLIFTRLCGYVPLYVLGLAHGTRNTVDWVPLAIALVSSMWGYFVHSNVRTGLGWLQHLIATPAFHHWHHDNIPDGRRHTNYAPLFPWIDRLFGTLQCDRARWPAEYGISEPVPSTLPEQLIRPFLPER